MKWGFITTIYDTNLRFDYKNKPLPCDNLKAISFLKNWEFESKFVDLFNGK